MKLPAFFHFIPTGIVLAAVVYLSLAANPVPDAPRFFDFPGSDKVVHCCMYFGLMLVFCFDYFRSRATRHEATVLPFALAVSIAIGGIIEILQWQMQMGRSGDWYDFAADCVGAALGLAAGLAVVKPLLAQLHQSNAASAAGGH